MLPGMTWIKCQQIPVVLFCDPLFSCSFLSHLIFFPHPAFPNKTRVAILAELEKERRRLMQNQSMNTPGARYGQYTAMEDNRGFISVTALQKPFHERGINYWYCLPNNHCSNLSFKWSPAVHHDLAEDTRLVSFALSSCSISLSRPSLKEFRDNAEQQHIAAQQKAALQVRCTEIQMQLHSITGATTNSNDRLCHTTVINWKINQRASYPSSFLISVSSVIMWSYSYHNST